MHLNKTGLKQWREDLGLTQEQLGRLLNLKQNTISQWEAGQRMPDLQSIIALAKIHNKSVEQVLRESHSFIAIETVDIGIKSERDIPKLLAQHAWFKYIEGFKRKTEAAGESFSSEDLRQNLKLIQESIMTSDQQFDLTNLPPSIYQNMCESMVSYLRRCIEMMERIEQLDALPDADKREQAYTLYKLGLGSSGFRKDFMLFGNDLDMPIADSKESSTSEEAEASSASEPSEGEVVEDSAAKLSDEDFAAADQPGTYN